MAIDPRFQRIARRLTTLELVVDGDGGDDAPLLPGDPSSRTRERFLGFYSRDGVLRALEAYGVLDALDQQGLGNCEVVISSRDPYRHRAQVLLDGVVDDEHRVVDLVIRMQRVRESALSEGRSGRQSFDLLLVEWLCLQNPRGRFSRSSPRLPGQRYPGLGLAYTFHNLTLLMAQRLGRDGVLNVPEHFHLAVMYRRTGYRFVCEQHKGEVDDVERGTRRLHLAASAWAAERGFIRVLSHDVPDESPALWSYTPAEMVAPVSKQLLSLLGSRGGLLRRIVPARPRLRVEVDVEGLRQSLVDDPVEGLDPEDVLEGRG